MAVGGRIDAVFFCPHTPEDGCDCRKPLPGLMLDIGRRYGIDLKQVPMVADTLRDLQAAPPPAASRTWC
jgi:D-glycero-D-manno-heptose 1,7-bisphosphate phosphatase